MLPPTIVTEMPGLHVTVVNGIHDITCERGVIRIWTYEQRRLGETIEHRVNGDNLMSLEDLLAMLDQIKTFLQTLNVETRTNFLAGLVPH